MPLVPGRVTVGIPTYNRAHFAERAARSVLAQTYPDIELVVSDDPFPGDDSAARIEALNPNGKIVRVVRQPQRFGLPANFDACLRFATGEYFLLLGDDDILRPEAIAELANAFQDPAEIGIVWCPCNIVDAEDHLLWTTPTGPSLETPEDFMVALWRGRRGARLSAILMRTHEAMQMGGFQGRYGDLCDIALWGQVAVSHSRVRCVPRLLVDYTNHSGSVTSISNSETWQYHAREVLSGILKRSRECGSIHAAETIERHQRDFLAGVTLTVLVQNVGKPGWVRLWVAEFWRSRRFMLTPFVLKRALKDGRKLLRLREKKYPPTR